MKVEFLVLPGGKCPVEVFLSTLENKTIAKVYRLIEILEEKGSLPFPHARKISGYKNLWELRILSSRKAVRIFYFYWEKDKIVLMDGIIKKSQKTPKKVFSYLNNLLKQAGVEI